MIIYNVTTKITWAIQEEWVKWMQQEHIPEIISTGCFHKYQFVQLLETDEADGPTYAIQYYAHSIVDYENFIRNFAVHLRRKATDKWGDQFIAFRSVMRAVN